VSFIGILLGFAFVGTKQYHGTHEAQLFQNVILPTTAFSILQEARMYS
jgi:hypothetical protein